MKKLCTGLVMLLMLVCIAGCGGEKPKDTADQAVLAFAELYAYGDTTNAAKTGMSEADIQKVSTQFQQATLQGFAAYKIPQSAQQELTNYYLQALKDDMEMKASIKTDSDKNPVVELSFKAVDIMNFTKKMQTDDILMQLAESRSLMEAAGTDPAQSMDYTDAVVQELKNDIDEMPMLSAKTIEVKCKLAKDDKEKLFWNPEDVQGLATAFQAK